MAKLQKLEISEKLKKPEASSTKQKVTLSIDSEIYKHFKDYCEENAIMLSKKIELWMEKALKERKESDKNG